jgi:ABC-type antimicrobial peptide transport system permease subunit
MRGLGRIHSEMLRDFYVTLDQIPAEETHVLLRPRGDATTAVEKVRDAVRAVDPTRAVFEVSTMEASIAEDRREMRFVTVLMILFAGVAAILTTVSVYSVMSYAASRRTREIGVRVALGASRVRVVRLVMKSAALDIAVGGLIGVSSALASSRMLSSLLYGVTPTDSVAFISIVPALALIALIAAFMPIRRALAVDPAEALRHE